MVTKGISVRSSLGRSFSLKVNSSSSGSRSGRSYLLKLTLQGAFGSSFAQILSMISALNDPFDFNG